MHVPVHGINQSSHGAPRAGRLNYFIPMPTIRLFRFFFLTALASALSACERPVPPPEAVRPVKVWVVAQEINVGDLVLACEVVARYEAPLAFQVGGKVIERKVNLGDRVRVGQVIGRLDAADYRLAVEAQSATAAAAQTELKLAEADLARYHSLREKYFISAAELDRRQANVDAARERAHAANANVGQAKRQLGYVVLAAGQDGVVTAMSFDVGQVVAAGQPVARLARQGPRELLVHVPEAELPRMRTAQKLSVTINTRPDQSHAASLRELAAAADAATRTYAARIAVEASEADLPLGASATLRVASANVQTIRLPLAAVLSRDGVARVWKVDAASGVVRAAVIATEGVSGGSIIVKSGLAPGDIVVIAGASLLREGQKVKPLP